MGQFLSQDGLGYVDGANMHAAHFAIRGGVDPWGYAEEVDFSSFDLDELAADDTAIDLNEQINARDLIRLYMEIYGDDEIYLQAAA